MSVIDRSGEAREVQGIERSVECGTGNTTLRKVMHLVVTPICLLFNMQTFPPFTQPVPFQREQDLI